MRLETLQTPDVYKGKEINKNKDRQCSKKICVVYRKCINYIDITFKNDLGSGKLPLLMVS